MMNVKLYCYITGSKKGCLGNWNCSLSLFWISRAKKEGETKKKKKEIRSDSYRCCVEEEEFRESENFVPFGSQLWNKRSLLETVDVNSDFLAGCTQN